MRSKEEAARRISGFDGELEEICSILLLCVLERF
jgi:hypothetical protein